MGKLRSVQILRAVAALSVVACHAFGWAFGAIGVDLFFVISGFIMGTVAPGQKPADFLIRRVWRIYPMWWLAAGLALAVFPLASPQTVYSSLTLWPIWSGQYVEPALFLGWTLTFEMLFYAGVAGALLTRPVIPLAALCVTMTAAWLVPGALLHYLGNPLILEFLFGLLIARVPAPRNGGWLMLPVGAGVLSLAPTLSFNGIEALHYLDTAVLRVVWCGIPCALIFYGALALEGRLKSKVWDVPVLLGNASYSIYLFHYFVTQSVSGLLGFLCATGAGLAIYWVVERRIIRLGASLRERPRNSVLVVATNG